MRVFNFPIYADVRSTRVFYGILAAQANSTVCWALEKMSYAKPQFPEWMSLPFVSSAWALSNYIALFWVVICGAAAVFPQSRVLRWLSFAAFALSTYVFYLWQGLWHGQAFALLCAAVFAASKIKEDLPKENEAQTNTWLQIFTFIYFIEVTTTYWSKYSLVGHIYIVAKIFLCLGLLSYFFRPSKSAPNFVLVILMLVGLDYAILANVEESVVCIALALLTSLLIRHTDVDQSATTVIRSIG